MASIHVQYETTFLSMSNASLETPRLALVLQSTDEVLAFIDSMPPEDRAEVSPVWLAMIRSATFPSPWTHAFKILWRGEESETVLGNICFKGPPDSEGMVEVAYGIDPQYQNQGIATEATHALVAYALEDEKVARVRANTMQNDGASARVLVKCGFQCVGQFEDPEDGMVWRWEKERLPVSA